MPCGKWRSPATSEFASLVTNSSATSGVWLNWWSTLAESHTTLQQALAVGCASYIVLPRSQSWQFQNQWFMMFLLDCQVMFENSPALDSQPAKGNLPIGSELRRLASLFLNLPVNGWLRGSNLWFFWVLGLPWGLGALGPGRIFGERPTPTVTRGMPTW